MSSASGGFAPDSLNQEHCPLGALPPDPFPSGERIPPLRGHLIHVP